MTRTSYDAILGGTDGGGGAAVEYAHQEVRSQILHGQLAPGEVISQVALAKVLGVSRTPLREALRMLQREGLIDAQANHSVRVASLSVEDAESLYVMRVTLEAVAIRISVPLMQTAEIAVSQGRLGEMSHLYSEKEYGHWERAHQTFHRGLVGHAGERMAREITQLYAHAERYRRVVATTDPNAWATGQEEHRQIVVACSKRDPDAAASLLAGHLARTGLTVISLLDPGYEPRALKTALACSQLGRQ